MPILRGAAQSNQGPSIAEMFEKKISDALKCWVCAKAQDRLHGAAKLLVCQRCRTARYCSKECQRAAWKEHKAACTPYVEFPIFRKDGQRNQDVRECRSSYEDAGGSQEVSDYERRLTLIESRAAQGDQDALADKAGILLELNNFDGAAAILLPLAEAGHAQSQNLVRIANSRLFTRLLDQTGPRLERLRPVKIDMYSFVPCSNLACQAPHELKAHAQCAGGAAVRAGPRARKGLGSRRALVPARRERGERAGDGARGQHPPPQVHRPPCRRRRGGLRGAGGQGCRVVASGPQGGPHGRGLPAGAVSAAGRGGNRPRDSRQIRRRRCSGCA